MMIKCKGATNDAPKVPTTIVTCNQVTFVKYLLGVFLKQIAQKRKCKLLFCIVGVMDIGYPR